MDMENTTRSQSHTKEKDEQARMFEEKLTILNENFIRFLRNSHRKNPATDFTPTINDYIKHMRDLDRMYYRPSDDDIIVLDQAPSKTTAEATAAIITLSALSTTSIQSKEPSNAEFATGSVAHFGTGGAKGSFVPPSTTINLGWSASGAQLPYQLFGASSNSTTTNANAIVSPSITTATPIPTAPFGAITTAPTLQATTTTASLLFGSGSAIQGFVPFTTSVNGKTTSTITAISFTPQSTVSIPSPLSTTNSSGPKISRKRTADSSVDDIAPYGGGKAAKGGRESESLNAAGVNSSTPLFPPPTAQSAKPTELTFGVSTTTNAVYSIATNTSTNSAFAPLFGTTTTAAISAPRTSLLFGSSSSPETTTTVATATTATAPTSLFSSSPILGGPNKGTTTIVTSTTPSATTTAPPLIFGSSGATSTIRQFSFGGAFPKTASATTDEKTTTTTTGTTTGAPSLFSFGNSGAAPKFSFQPLASSTRSSLFGGSVGSVPDGGNSATGSVGDTQGEGSVDEPAEEFVPKDNFKPVVPLPPKVDVRSGEEGDEVLFETRCKLFRFDKEAKQNKERGFGDLKLLSNKATGRFRCVIRSENQLSKLFANFPIHASMKMTPHSKPNTVTWTCRDFSEKSAEGMDEIFLARFKDAAVAGQFSTWIQEIAAKLEKEK